MRTEPAAPSSSAVDTASPAGSATAPLFEAEPEEPVAAPPMERAMTDAEANAQVGLTEVRVQLLSEGSEPKRELRYAKEGARASLVLDVELATMRSTPGDDPDQPVVPGLQFDLSVERTGTGAETGWRFVVGAARARATTEAEQLLAEEMAPIVASLGGKAGAWRTGMRGIEPGATTHPDGLDLDALQLWSSVEESLRELSPPFPEKPVGPGATWRAVSRLSRAGVPVVRTVDYELRSGEGVVLAFVARERPVATQRPDPLLPEGVGVVAHRGVGRGAGAIELDGDFAPRRANLRVDLWSELDIHGPAGTPSSVSTVRLHQHVRVKRQP